MSLPCDWQVKKQKLSERAGYLLVTGQWSDCKFVVGQDPHQQILKGHKLFLAMASPVFEAMFFGSMAEKNDPIPIRDVQPEAFKAMLKYVYTNHVELNSFDLACELCYCAKKYMLPFLVEDCTRYLWADLSPKKTSRAFEFAKLFEEPVLMDKCLQMICSKTSEILKEPTWEDVDLATLITVLEQEELQIDSELELFVAVERWAKSECTRKSLDHTDSKSLKSVVGDALSKIRFLTMSSKEFLDGPGCSLLLTKEEAFGILANILCSTNETGIGKKTPMPEGFSLSTLSRLKRTSNTRCLDFYLDKLSQVESPQDSSNDGVLIMPSTSFNQTISNDEKSMDTSHVVKLGNRESGNHSINNSSNTVMDGGTRQETKYYCLRSVFSETTYFNFATTNCSLTFRVNKNICVLGVQVPTQISGFFQVGQGFVPIPDSAYTEILYAHLLDSDGTRLTYTHFTPKVNTGTLIEIMFGRPIYIQKHKIYKVGVMFNKAGWYPMASCSQQMFCDTVFFDFTVGSTGDSVQSGLIRSIVFTHQH